MRIKCTDYKTFRLTDNDQFLGELAYKSLFSYQAEITLPNSDHYNIKSIGFFGTSMAVTKNETEIVTLKMNWKGRIVMTNQDEQEFVFKAKGTFHNKYVIENAEEEELIRFDPTFNWGKFNYDYEVSYDTKRQDTLFVLLGVYAANYYTAAVAGSV